MAEISNKALALLVLAALVVVVAATTIQLNQLNAIGITGMPTDEESGLVQLQIASSVAIEVVDGTIDFGSCTPLPGPGILVRNSSDREEDGNCTVTNVAPEFDYIQVNNIGNVDVNLTVEGEDPATWVTGTSPQFRAYFPSAEQVGCNSDLLEAETAIHTAEQLACGNLTAATGYVRMFGVVEIPSNAVTGSRSNTVTFFAEII